MRGEVRFYGPLNDLVAPERRRLASETTFAPGETVKDLVEALGVPHTEVDVVLVDGRPVAFDHRLADGDRVAVFPRFMSLDVPEEVRLGRDPEPPPRFLADVHLGRLARHLRLLGFDCEYEPAADDSGLARRSAEDGRVLLTRDRGLLKRRQVAHGYLVRGTAPRRQLDEVVARFGLADWASPFSRCLACNEALESVAKDRVAAVLPAAVRRDRHSFTACPGCGRVYWRGSHYERLSSLVDSVLRASGSP